MAALDGLTVLIGRTEIEKRVEELGKAISGDAAPGPILAIVILKGAFMFAADLIRAIQIPVEVDFMAVSSYGAATKSTGVVRIAKDLDASIEGRDVLIVEDIVDTGLTLRYLQRTLLERHPRSLRTAVFLDKSSRRIVDVPVEYTGFAIPDRFVVGYGLDFDQKDRHHPDLLYLASPEGQK